MDLSTLRSENRVLMLRLAAKHGATNMRVFGSVARGQAASKSDIDLLVDFEAGRSLFDLARLSEELSQLLGCPVDIATVGSLREPMRTTILREAVTL
jgi:hypothetical protein